VREQSAALPDRVLTIDGVAMAAYAGATWDWIQTHLDSAVATAAGFPRPIVDGQMLGALLAAHAQDGLGAGARVVAMSFRHADAVYRADRVRISGTRGAMDAEGEVVVTQSVHVLGDDGSARPVITGARTTVRLPLPGH
jgi:acyl dehydratase